ncbi:C4-dicarboxylate TRAP transporter substrate-binding protein [Nitratireductor sp. ZSWI3]|uniref:C4-dicarboxylate TRAP transporter substrate-binding protein n=1 Tax=Nitratireductor sp. ZSWI3 TaxID=2966359 RepID=UPI00214FEF3B|nr:C4-dicarboxylate TRAP transporter substrate-binding protein [Nitratireductor sp. ZSWI3]MCR4267553.1 C4-dicarboxylate TRAP transporter substrate-binding protein [Nitratireductor sp. ZSWI3]
MSKLLTATAALALCLSAGMAMAETTLILGEAGPNRGARAKSLEHFVEEVSKRSNGEVKIDVQWGGALFKASGAVQGVADGVADIGTIIAVYFPQEMLSYNIADLPLLNEDAWVGMRATDELMRTAPAIQADLGSKNLVYIGTFTTSQVNIGCKGKAIKSVGDISGLKVRGVGAYGDTFADLGANMVNMSIYDAYQGLDTGLIDCSQGYSYAVAALKQQEVMTSYTLLNWGQVGGLGLFMNKDSFDAQDEATKTALAEAGVAMADKLGELINTDNEAAIGKMKDAGVEVISLPAGERDKLVAAGEKYVAEWVERATAAGLDGEALLSQYKDLLAKYEKEKAEKGYPWQRN